MARGKRILFKKATIDRLEFSPSESGLSPVLAVSAGINKEIAGMLRCSFLFKENGDPQDGWTTHGVDGKLADIEVVMPYGNDTQVIRPKWAHKFTVTKDNDVSCSVKFRIAFDTGKALDLIDFATTTNKGDFELSLRSLQQEFDFSGATGGTPSPEPDDEKQPALVSAGEMGIGTHQKRAKRTRQPQVDETTVEEVEEAVSVQ